MSTRFERRPAARAGVPSHHCQIFEAGIDSQGMGQHGRKYKEVMGAVD